MIIPVRFHILTVLLLFQCHIGISQSASSSDEDCQNRVRIVNESSCQHSIYIKSFDEVYTESFVGLLDPGEERFVDSKSSNVFVFAVNDLNQQVAGALSMNCESKDLAIASCYVDQPKEDTDRCHEVSLTMLKNGTSASSIIDQVIASCGDNIDLELIDAQGIGLWTMPNKETVITTDLHRVNLGESIDEYYGGTYSIDWFDQSGCHTLRSFELKVANCCALQNTMLTDTVLCSGDSLRLIPQISNTNICTEILSGYAANLFDQNGNVEDVDLFAGPKDSYGPILYKEATNEQTYIILELDDVVPADGEICLTIRQGTCSDSPFSSSNFSISAGGQFFSLDDRFEFNNEKLPNSFTDYCFTVSQATSFVKLEDHGEGCGIRFDALSWRKNNDYEKLKFVWSDGSSRQFLTVKSPGIYSLQVIDCNGCSTFDEVLVGMNNCDEIAEPEPCEESYSIPSAVQDAFTACASVSRLDGDVGTNDLDLDGFDLIFEKIQNPNNGIVTLQEDGSFFYYPNEGFSGVDNFQYSLCKKDFSPCHEDNEIYRCATGLVTLTLHAPTVDLGPESASICIDDNYILSVPESMDAVWSTGQQGNAIALNKTGNYKVSVTDEFGCVATDEINLEVYDKPSIEVSKSNDLTCAFNSSTISVTGQDGDSYAWNTGQSGARIAVEQPGEYLVTVTNTSGCRTESSISVEEKISDIVVVISGSKTICSESDSYVLSAFGANSFVWSTGQTGQSIEAFGTGTYSVTATDSETGCTGVSSKTISLLNNFANAGEDIYTCFGSEVTIGSSLVGPDNAFFLWDNGASGRISSTSNGQVTVVANQTQTYTVRVSVNNCILEDQVTVFVEDFKFSTTGNVNICKGSSTSLSAFGANAYQWNTGDQSPEILVSPTQTTTYSVIGKSEGGCQSEQKITVFVEEELSTTISADQVICPGASTTLNATGGNVYEWNNGAFGASITVSPDVSTNYAVTIRDVAGCAKIETVNVFVEPIASFSLGEDRVVCRNSTHQITAPQADTYAWSTGENTQTIQINPSGSNSYSVTITQGQCSATDEIIFEGVDCFGDISGFSLTDEGEPLTDPSISLLQNDQVLESVFPDEDGFYKFDALAPGEYIVQQSELRSYSNFSDEDETPDDRNDVDEANNLINVTLTSNESDSDNNFRDVKNTGEISGFSIVDINGDGTGDRVFLGEIILRDEAGVFLQNTKADPNNNAQYKFEGLSPGHYFVELVLLEGFSSIFDSDETTSALDQDGLNDPVDNKIPVTLTLNEIDLGNNFIVRQTTETKISGYVMLDLDNDGVGETPQPDVAIDLTIRGGRQARVKTDVDGYYEFKDLSEGNYEIREDDDGQNGYASLYDRDDSLTSFDTDGYDEVADNAIYVELFTGEHDANNNFVNFIPSVGVISGSVLLDVTGNPDDYLGQGGIAVSLYTNTDLFVAITTTNNAGAYVFNDVPVGDYKLVETDVFGFEDVSDYDRIDPDDPNDQDGTNDIINVSIVADEVDSGNDFVNRRTEGAIVETCSVLQVDDFTSGNSNLWKMGGSNARIVTGVPFPNGTIVSAVDINNDNDIESSIYSEALNLGDRVNSVKLSFNFYVRQADADDYFVLEVSQNGGNSFSEIRRWTTTVDYNNGIWVYSTVTILKENLSEATVFRIRSELDSTVEHVFLDDITIELCYDENEDNGGGTAFVGQNSHSTLARIDKHLLTRASSYPVDQHLDTQLSTHFIETSGKSDVFPNPTSDILNVNVANHFDEASEITFDIYSLDGQLRMTKRLMKNSLINLDLRDLESEQLYILYIRQENKQPEMFRFLKIK